MVEALAGAISELDRIVGEPMPTIDMVHALVKQRAVEAGCLSGVSFCQLVRLQQHYR